MLSNRNCLILAISLVLALVTTARADILNVPGDFGTIQGAIDAAVDGDSIEVQPGTYTENLDLMGKQITLYSVEGPAVTTIAALNTGTGPSFVTPRALALDAANNRVLVIDATLDALIEVDLTTGVERSSRIRTTAKERSLRTLRVLILTL